jgi:hypothetical protein
MCLVVETRKFGPDGKRLQVNRVLKTMKRPDGVVEVEESETEISTVLGERKVSRFRVLASEVNRPFSREEMELAVPESKLKPEARKRFRRKTR